MKRALLILAVLLSLGCSDALQPSPSPLYPSYFLSSVDGQLLPVPYAADGTLLLAGSLGFGGLDRPRAEGQASGTVSYSLIVRWPDQSVHHSTIELDYTIEAGVLRINLCPPLALCIASTDLVGPILGPYQELVLTYYLSGNPGSVYRYGPALPD
ncbi:MAG TPA: hypothetical protein VGQ69_15945 [Gemmatimonadales bacterium]|jgi:hypothetical protein|nr:hypothetical protein [Gemmatimonadales bacterium]